MLLQGFSLIFQRLFIDVHWFFIDFSLVFVMFSLMFHRFALIFHWFREQNPVSQDLPSQDLLSQGLVPQDDLWSRALKSSYSEKAWEERAVILWYSVSSGRFRHARPLRGRRILHGEGCASQLCSASFRDSFLFADLMMCESNAWKCRTSQSSPFINSDTSSPFGFWFEHHLAGV